MNKKLRKKYITLFIFYCLLNSFIIYYVSIFCFVYPNSGFDWFNATINSLFIDVVLISMVIFPLTKTTVKLIIRNFPLLRFLILIEYAFFLTNYFV